MDAHQLATSWNPQALNGAASYVAFTHSELETALESAFNLVLRNALKCTRYRSEQIKRLIQAGDPPHAPNVQELQRVHPVMLNALAYFRNEQASRIDFDLGTVPKRSQLATNPKLADSTWKSAGAGRFYEERIDRNHGAAQKHIISIFQPLGVEIEQGNFVKRFETVGIQRLCAVPQTNVTELGEFAKWRGAAVHGGLGGFKAVIGQSSPSDVVRRVRFGVETATDICTLLARNAWA